MKEDELQSILNYLLTMHEVNGLLWERATQEQTVGAVECSARQNAHYNLELWLYLNE